MNIWEDLNWNGAMTSGAGTTTFEGQALSNLYIYVMWNTDP
jgi:hypothetical protein